MTGVEKPRLANVSEVIRGRIEDKSIQGAMVVIEQEGELLHHEAAGMMDFAPEHPNSLDNIQWVASLTKVVITAALLALGDESKLSIEDEVGQYLPEFSGPGQVRVWDSPPPFVMPFGPPPEDLPGFHFEPAERPLRLHDLLTHTGGLQSIWIYNPDFSFPDPSDSLATYVPKLASLPLDFQPGTRWAYSNAASFDVLARIIEVVSESRLDQFLRERVFGPLRMETAAFGDSVDRARTVPLTGMFADNPAVTGSYHSGAAGLWMTIDDYVTFLRMLLDKGGDIVSADAVETMTSGRVPGLHVPLNGRDEEMTGLGMGFAVLIVEDQDATGLAVPKGAYGWDGMTVQRFWVYPDDKRVLYMYVSNPEVQAELEQAVASELG